jgi:cytochrome c oxidase cbb3-type subunit III
MRTAQFAIVLCIAFAVASCKREERNFTSPSPATLGPVPLVDLEPGGGIPPKPDVGKDYEQNAYHLSEGKRLFQAFNCNGCHFNGGGGMGPALMDDVWIYGGDFPNIASSIRDGRPNGMPSFGRVVPLEQIYEIAAYVRSLGGFVPTNAAPNRDDKLQSRPGENRMQDQPAVGPVPPAGITPEP